MLFEAFSEPGGQILLAAKVQRRREILGITDWLYAEVTAPRRGRAAGYAG